MKNNQLNKVIGLVTRTGDNALVVDKETDEVLVIMSLDKYEELLDDAESIFLEDRIEDQEDQNKDRKLPEEETFPWETAWSGQDIEMPVILRPTAPMLAAESGITPDFANDWTAESKRASDLGESLTDVPSEEEEEKFYLEPVE